MSDEPAPGPGRELGRWNRPVIAARMGWPTGAVETCEAIEEMHPDWDVFWHHENTITGFEQPAGFYATPEEFRNAVPAYGVDAESLSAAILALSSSCPDCGVRLPVPPGSTPPSHQDGTGHCQVRWTQTTRPAS